MLTPVDYDAFRTLLTPRVGLLLPPTYLDYCNYERQWENYIIRARGILGENNPPRVGLIAMESAPGSLVHPGPNYIFNDLAEIVTIPSDKYLSAIYNGANDAAGVEAAGKTKQFCLDGLLGVTDAIGLLRPLILFDLFPSHGIGLETGDRRRLADTKGKGLPPQITAHLTSKLNFIFTNVLNPTGLNWENVSLKFSCPPTSMSISIQNQIIATCAGIAINPINLNTVGRGIAPSAATLAGCILNNGF